MKIYACPRCGSREIFMGTIDSGVLIGVSSTKSVCRNCGFQGNPLLFTSKKQYQQFIEEIKKQDVKEKNGKEKESTKKEGLTEKDRLVLDYVKDIKLYRCPTGKRGEYRTYSIVDSMNGLHLWRAGLDYSYIMKIRSQIKKPDKRFVFIDEGKS